VISPEKKIYRGTVFLGREEVYSHQGGCRDYETGVR
jgi:hypothetical protein